MIANSDHDRREWLLATMLDGELNDQESGEFAAELASDPAFADEVRVLARSGNVLGIMCDERSAQAFADQVLSAHYYASNRDKFIDRVVRSAAKQRQRSADRRFWSGWLLVAAGLLIGIGLLAYEFVPQRAHAENIANLAPVNDGLAKDATKLDTIKAGTVVIGRVAAASSNSTIERSGHTLEMTDGMEIFSRDLLRIGNQGPVAFVFSDDATSVTLAPGTQATLGRERRGKRITLLAGAVTCSVAKQPQDMPMILNTAEALATVVGTRFRFSEAAGITRLEVTEGRVLFIGRRTATNLQVSAGQSASGSALIDVTFDP